MFERMRRTGLAVVAGMVIAVASVSPASASFTIGASNVPGAPNTCTVSARKPVISSGRVSSTFSVTCTVATALSFTVQLRESDGLNHYQRLAYLTSSYYVEKPRTEYVVSTPAIKCMRGLPIGTGANTEPSNEELYTFVAATWGGYPATSENSTIPAEDGVGSFEC